MIKTNVHYRNRKIWGSGKCLMAWGCFSGRPGSGPTYRIEGVMNKYICNSILENQMIAFVDKVIPLR